MYEVLKSDGLTGGFNFDAKTRRPSYTHEDMFQAFVLGMDTFALGLIKAAELIEDGRMDAFVKERYESYAATAIGQKIRAGEATLAECAAVASRNGAPALPGSGRQEYLEAVMNQILFGKA
jgi:xylose isomerase